MQCTIAILNINIFLCIPGQEITEIKIVAPVEEPEPRKAAPAATAGFPSNQVMMLFARRESAVPEGVDPNSYEAMKHCGYIRTSSPIEDNEGGIAYKNAGRRLSSWAHVE